MKDQFIDLSVRLQKVLDQEKFHIVPFEDASLPFFSKLTPSEQQLIIDQLKNLLEIGWDLHSQEKKITEPANLIRTFFKKFNLHAPAWVVDSITNNDIVDVYSLDSRLIIASLNFFDICTYSVEELFCRPWAELFYREGETHIQIYQLCRSLLNGEITQPVDMTYIPQHKVRETYSSEERYVILQPRIFSPIYADNEIFGFMSINRIVKLQLDQTSKTT